ncbi:Innexin [Teladorsagia circumcincta]|uniref:Innexin n=1 Tax=Teladorsagia circumcincta TaxID=45464 RepID=A0A2G9V582_TELCI|nr:Innexin [Teladorsagia circumcincta]
MARYLSPRHDDDWSDRLHYLITPNILFAFSVLISFKQFGGRPIECMFPNKFPGSWEQYAENYCWSQDTYFVEPQQHVELLKQDQRYTPERQLSYYQWVPFFLLLQAVFFRAPSFLWKAFSNHSGIRMHEVVEKAKDSANVEEEVRQKNIGILARHLQNALRFKRRMDKRQVIVHKTVTCLNYQYSSGFVSAVYLFTKGLYLINSVVQLYLMNRFLGTNKYQWYGLGVIQDIIRGVEWDKSGFFPRSAICDFEAITPITPNGEDALQTELKSVTATALMPVNPENEDKRSNSSDERRP